MCILKCNPSLSNRQCYGKCALSDVLACLAWEEFWFALTTFCIISTCVDFSLVLVVFISLTTQHG